MMYSVAVIIPARNRLELLRKCINSVYSQSCVNEVGIKIILVDDGSNPPLKPILQPKYPNVHFVNNSGVHSPSAARNFGLNFANKATYVAFLDSDDVWDKYFLEKSLATISKEASAVMCLSRPIFIGSFSTKEILIIKMLHLIKDFSIYGSYIFNNGRLPKSGFFLTHVSHTLIRNSVIANSKFPEFTGGEDWLYFAKILNRGHIDILPTRLVSYIYSKNSTTQNSNYAQTRKVRYKKLLSRIPRKCKKGILYFLFKRYIQLSDYLFS